MRLRFGFKGEVSLEDRGGRNMSDWSREMAEKLKNRLRSQQVRDEKFVELQRMKREIGPKLWDAVKSDVRSEASALNLDLGQEVIREEKTAWDEMILLADLNDGVRRSHVKFESEPGLLTSQTDNGSTDAFELALDSRNGRLAFHASMFPQTTGSIAKQILDRLLEPR
jgi:hypothetical protein